MTDASELHLRKDDLLMVTRLSGRMTDFRDGLLINAPSSIVVTLEGLANVIDVSLLHFMKVPSLIVVKPVGISKERTVALSPSNA
jgi:hypothetical protein